MSCGFLADGVREVLGDGSPLGLRLRFVEEPEPRGHGRRAEARRGDARGALPDAQRRRADRHRPERPDRPARGTGARATLALVKVPDPTRLRDGASSTRTTRFAEFVEKPSSEQPPSSLISAGAYVLEREILDLMPPDRNVSIEREVWPRLIGNGLYGYASESYWLDIGTPERYLKGTFDIIEGNVQTAVQERLGDSWIALGRGRRGARPGDPARRCSSAA